jgi:hypothetical protein
VYVSAAEQKDNKEKAQMDAAAIKAAAQTGAASSPAAPLLRAPLPAGRELAESIARNPLAALLAAEVFGPCRAAAEIGEGSTSPVGLRGS